MTVFITAWWEKTGIIAAYVERRFNDGSVLLVNELEIPGVPNTIKLEPEEFFEDIDDALVFVRRELIHKLLIMKSMASKYILNRERIVDEKGKNVQLIFPSEKVIQEKDAVVLDFIPKEERMPLNEVVERERIQFQNKIDKLNPRQAAVLRYVAESELSVTKEEVGDALYLKMCPSSKLTEHERSLTERSCSWAKVILNNLTKKNLLVMTNETPPKFTIPVIVVNILKGLRRRENAEKR